MFVSSLLLQAPDLSQRYYITLRVYSTVLYYRIHPSSSIFDFMFFEYTLFFLLHIIYILSIDICAWSTYSNERGENNRADFPFCVERRGCLRRASLAIVIVHAPPYAVSFSLSHTPPVRLESLPSICDHILVCALPNNF